jgi:hypothetical protein
LRRTFWHNRSLLRTFFNINPHPCLRVISTFPCAFDFCKSLQVLGELALGNGGGGRQRFDESRSVEHGAGLGNVDRGRKGFDQGFAFVHVFREPILQVALLWPRFLQNEHDGILTND